MHKQTFISNLANNIFILQYWNAVFDRFMSDRSAIVEYHAYYNVKKIIKKCEGAIGMSLRNLYAVNAIRREKKKFSESWPWPTAVLYSLSDNFLNCSSEGQSVKFLKEDLILCFIRI